MGSPLVWFTAIAGLVLLALVVGVLLVLLARRRLWKLRAGGIEVALRAYRADPGRGWHLGIAHYRGEEFAWYRALSLRSGPDRILDRSRVEITSRREPAAAERYTMPGRPVVLHLSRPGQDIELAMGPDALTGFLSWLESAPPSSIAPWNS